MIEGITLAFAAGLFAVVCPCAIALAAALIGLPVCAAADREGGPAPDAIGAAAAIRAAVAIGLSFAVVFVLAALAVSAGLGRVFDVIPWLAAAAGVALAAVGAEVVFAGAIGGRLALLGDSARSQRPWRAAAFGAVYAITALPCMLGVFRAFVDQGVEANGAGAAVAVTLGFGAGCASALAVLTVATGLALAGTNRLTAAAREVARRAAGALVAVAGVSLVLYWLPALLGGRIERGGAAAGATEDLSSAITEALARYELVFALVLLAISALALAAVLRPRSR